ncbi:MAG: diguanylate cyclase [Blastocatellia bacterium]
MESEKRKKWARHYIDALLVAGLSVTGYSLLVHGAGMLKPSWLLLAMVVYLVSRHVTISIPGTKGEVTIHDTFVIVGLFLHGVEAGTILAAISGAGASAHCAKTKRTLFLNIAMMALSVFVAGYSSQLLTGISLSELIGDTRAPGLLFFVLTFLSLVYFAINTAFVSLAVSIRTGQGVYDVWKDGFLWSSITHFVGALAAWMALEAITIVEFYGLIILIPVLLITYFSYKKFFDKVEASNREVQSIADRHLATIEALALAIDAKDRIGRGHARRVQIAAIEIALELEIRDPAILEALKAAALLHDIGKLAVPDHILNKPGELTPAEIEKVKIHPEVSAKVLSGIDFPYPVVPIVRAHHEWWNGQGYPQGLKADQIPMGARILTAADIYDAIRTRSGNQISQSATGISESIREHAGRELDPVVAEACCRSIEKIEEKLRQISIPDMKLETGDPQISGESLRTFTGFTQDVYQDIADAQNEILELYELSQALANMQSLGDLLKALSEHLYKTLPFDSCAIFLSDPVNKKIQVSHAAGLHSDWLTGKTIEFGEGLSGKAAAIGEPMINIRANFDFPFLAQGEHPLLYSVAVPIITQGKTLGVISLYSISYQFRQEEVRQIESFASYTAAALNNILTLEETREDAYTDELTGLPNVRYLNTLLEQKLVEISMGGKCELTLLMLDLDGFKAVNDTHGHEIGDEVLRRVGKLMRENLRSSDTLVRQGGDEFVAVLLTDSTHSADQMIRRLQEAVDNFTLPLENGQTAHVGVSIGQAIFPTDGVTFKEIKETADKRMYANKKQRKTAQLSNTTPFRAGTGSA